MSSHAPISSLPTHEVANVPTLLEDYDLFASDPALREATLREGGAWTEAPCSALGRELGQAEVIALGAAANRYPPELRAFDRFGRRIDEVEFHPAYHQLMKLAIEHRLPSIAWHAPRPGSHVAHIALGYMFTQIEAGVLCPMAMTYAAVPALRVQPELAAQWEPRLLSPEYDRRCIPADRKRGATFGMAMTEKQGGSDVRANTTRAQPIDGGGPGNGYLLNGHKWFCSAPMSDGFLTLAQTERGLSCFLVARFRPDGTRNNFFIQRLKDKLGNKSNASSEIEYVDTFGQLVGEEGRGVQTIIEMVHHTRIDAATAPVGMMRQAVVQAVHHCSGRSAFGKRLVDQPLMRNVLADLEVEVEAATLLSLRLARAFDEAGSDDGARAFARLATAVAKYWTNKRAPGHIVEALECLGGAGYIEENPLARLYREAPLNGIWEGSGNVICLDVLRTLQREPQAPHFVLAELRTAAAARPELAAHLRKIEATLRSENLEVQARSLVQDLAIALQAALLIEHGDPAIADAFCRTRLGGEPPAVYGKLPVDVDARAIVRRAEVRAS
ncbi:MAG: acyl-CoA dehydrogenase family protein [Deltaproteobacteria bacterium]|nr:acyl-CoA dehydrogenase family protein [Nannocystaceae bacterium]